jgi:FkbH-like protein
MRSFAEMQRTLRSADTTGMPGLSLHVLRNVTVEPMEPFLRFAALQAGFAASVSFSAFAGAVQAAIAGDTAVASADGVLLWMHLDSIAPGLAREFPTLTPTRVAEEQQRVSDEIARMARGVRSQTRAPLLLVGFHSPPYAALGMADEQNAHGQLGVVRALNDELRALAGEIPSTYFVDLEQWQRRLGAERFLDERYWHIARAPFSRDALRGVAESAIRLLLSLRGRSRKCLVLDCDNVLWGGVIADDGLEGIALGTEYPGSAYREFQQEVKNLAARGVIVALCSKNDPENLWKVFREHPGMLLGEKDVIAHRINWNDKAENLREIADEIGIGLDSLVFMDDSEFEIERVRAALPMVEAVLLPVDSAVLHRTRLLAGGWFDQPVTSAEDLQRAAMYRAEATRRQIRAEIPDLREYLRSLEMIADVSPVGAADVARVAQLTQRTNQFNLTTRRYSADDVRALAESPESDVLTIRLRDRLGDAGLVGAAIVRYGAIPLVDSFLMSCRVMGRGVEQVLAEACVHRARARGFAEIEALYIPSARNGMTADFWPSVGFGTTVQAPAEIRYRRKTAVVRNETPWFKEIRYSKSQTSGESENG